MSDTKETPDKDIFDIEPKLAKLGDYMTEAQRKAAGERVAGMTYHAALDALLVKVDDRRGASATATAMAEPLNRWGAARKKVFVAQRANGKTRKRAERDAAMLQIAKDYKAAHPAKGLDDIAAYVAETLAERGYAKFVCDAEGMPKQRPDGTRLTKPSRSSFFQYLKGKL
jgi:hypothetical protein